MLGGLVLGDSEKPKNRAFEVYPIVPIPTGFSDLWPECSLSLGAVCGNERITGLRRSGVALIEWNSLGTSLAVKGYRTFSYPYNQIGC
jgi:hypothetical protein